MKKYLSFCLAIFVAVSLSACGGYDSNVWSRVLYDRNDPESILNALALEFESAAQSITDDSTNTSKKLGDSYDTYSNNKAVVLEFYANSLETAEELYASVKNISTDYFRYVAGQGISEYRVWDNSMRDFYDAWDDGMDDFYKVWDSAYDDIYDQCDDLIDDAYDIYGYEEGSDAWSKMYRAYSDSWSAMYRAYSDAWSRTYRNYSDVWSGFYRGNSDVDAILSNAENLRQSSGDTRGQESGDDRFERQPSTGESCTVEGLRPEFKEAMDSYEAFYDRYCVLMEEYLTNPADLTLLAEYMDILIELETMDEKFEAWESEDMSEAELLYYLEVSARVASKLWGLLE